MTNVVLRSITFSPATFAGRGHLALIEVEGTSYPAWQAMWTAGLLDIGDAVAEAEAFAGTATTQAGLSTAAAAAAIAAAEDAEGLAQMQIAGLAIAAPATGDLIPFGDVSDDDNPKRTTIGGVLALVPKADQATAEAGLDNEASMTALRTKQAIAAQAAGVPDFILQAQGVI